MRFIVAMFAAILPRRWWPPIERHLPVRQAAVMSGIATFLLAIAIGLPAFLAFAQANAGRAIDMMLEATGWRSPTTGASPVSVEAAQASWVGGFPAIFVFAFFTPIGLLATYLAFTGWFRAISPVFDDARGDPLLTMIDAVALRWRGRRDERRATEARHRLEGEEVADRVMSGASAGIPGAEIVVVTSRQKAGWVEGAFVITQEKWYRIGSPVERHTPNGLRTLYPLNVVGQMEVLRKGIRYVLPETIGDKPLQSHPPAAE
jgi:hypothetical protein